MGELFGGIVLAKDAGIEQWIVDTSDSDMEISRVVGWIFTEDDLLTGRPLVLNKYRCELELASSYCGSDDNGDLACFNSARKLTSPRQTRKQEGKHGQGQEQAYQ